MGSQSRIPLTRLPRQVTLRSDQLLGSEVWKFTDGLTVSSELLAADFVRDLLQHIRTGVGLVKRRSHATWRQYHSVAVCLTIVDLKSAAPSEGGSNAMPPHEIAMALANTARNGTSRSSSRGCRDGDQSIQRACDRASTWSGNEHKKSLYPRTRRPSTTASINSIHSIFQHISDHLARFSTIQSFSNKSPTISLALARFSRSPTP